jgi:hypothetical protein
VWHFAREATEDLTHADSRLWQTLFALLVRPGALTREYLDGHRVRYLPPLRLYLVLSVAFFLIDALRPPQIAVLQIHQSDSPGSTTAVGKPRFEWHFSEPMPPERVVEICQNLVQNSGSLRSRFELTEQFVATRCHKMFSDGLVAFSAAFRENLPRALFLLLPLLALFPLLLYWHPRRYYVEHLLFFVHNHAFTFLILGLSNLVALALPAVIGAVIGIAVALYLPFYLFRAMRCVYGQGRARTLAKFLVLLFVYAVSGIGVMLGTLAYTALTLQ